MREGAPDHIPTKRNSLSKKASRRFLFGVIVVTLFLAFLAAMGIKSAAENEAFQEEVKEMRRQYDPNYEDVEKDANEAPAAASPDSTMTVSPSN